MTLAFGVQPMDSRGGWVKCTDPSCTTQSRPTFLAPTLAGIRTNLMSAQQLADLLREKILLGIEPTADEQQHINEAANDAVYLLGTLAGAQKYASMTVRDVQVLVEQAQFAARVLREGRESIPQAEIDGGMGVGCSHARVNVFSGRGNVEHYTERGDCEDCGEPVLLTYGRAEAPLSVRVMNDAEQAEYDALKAASASEDAMEASV